MKQEKFNLSKKRQDTNKGTYFIRYAYLEEDVKEFIRKLKEEIEFYPDMRINNCYNIVIKDIIDTLAGDKLIEKKGK